MGIRQWNSVEIGGSNQLSSVHGSKTDEYHAFIREVSMTKTLDGLAHLHSLSRCGYAIRCPLCERGRDRWRCRRERVRILFRLLQNLREYFCNTHMAA